MRKKLRDFNWHIYGLSEDDLDYTIDIVEKLINSRMKEVRQETKHLEKATSVGAGETLSDMRHYAWVETQYLWHFCLWRLQAIFEGLITGVFLRIDSDDKLLGLKAKLNAMRAAGYSVSQEVFDELLDWANLRNALSHFPPEQYRPLVIERNDIDEYLKLVKSLITNWRITEQTHT